MAPRLPKIITCPQNGANDGLLAIIMCRMCKMMVGHPGPGGVLRITPYQFRTRAKTLRPVFRTAARRIAPLAVIYVLEGCKFCHHCRWLEEGGSCGMRCYIHMS